MSAPVAAITPRDVVLWDDFSGRLEAVERVDVRARVGGAVQATHFAEGELVKAGDLLVTIDPAPYAAEVQRLEAQVAGAEARVALTASDLERGRRLSDQQIVTARDLDVRANAFKEAKASLDAAKAALAAARLNLGYTEIRAAVAGRVGRREVTPGNLVTAGAGRRCSPRWSRSIRSMRASTPTKPSCSRRWPRSPARRAGAAGSTPSRSR